MTPISVQTTANKRLISTCGDLIERLQSIDKIKITEERDDVLRRMRNIINLLPTGARNFSDLMSNHESTLNFFGSEQFPVLLQEVISKFNNEELSQELSQLLTITDNSNFIIETLNVLTSGKLLDNNAPFMANLIEYSILRDETYLIFSLIRLSHNGINDLEMMKIDSYIQQIVSIPDKIANRMKSNFPVVFKEDVYVSTLMLNILKAFYVMVHINGVEKRQLYDFKVLAKLISKIMGNFKATRAINCAIRILSSQAEQMFYQESVRDIMKSLQRNAIEVVAKEAFGSETKKVRLLKMFGTVWQESIEWKFVLCKKIPLFNYSNNDLLIDNLVFFLAHEDAKLMEELLMELLMIWNTKAHVFETPFEQHFYLTKFIVLIVNYVTNIKGHAEEIRKNLFSGVQMHLESSDEKLRALGMITAETVIKIIDGDSVKEEEKLKFDYDALSEKIQNQIVKVIKEFPSRKISIIESSDFDEKYFDSLMEELLLISENKTIIKATKIVEIKAIPKIIEPLKTVEIELDSDDDDLQPYPEDSSSLARNDKSPRYLLDIIKALTVKEELDDVERFEATITKALEIIKQQLPNNHSDIATDLLKIFLEIEMQSYVENFEDKKMKTIIEICSIHPKECAQYLCQEFNTEMSKYTMRMRMYMLDVLGETAKRLSKLEMPKKDEIKPTSSPSIGVNKLTIKLQEELTNRNKRDAQKIIRERLIAKTRRIATKTKSIHEISGVNHFASIAGWFYFPLINGFGKEQMKFTKGTNLKNDVENILVIKFLHTISIIMLCSENAPIATKMAKEIVNLSIFLRYHEESQIRLAVLHMFATILLAIPKKILVKEFTAELNEFMSHLNMIVKSTVVNYEPDKECREFANQLIAMCQNALYAYQNE